MPIKNEPPTPGQVAFVRDNMEQMTLKQMGALMDKSITEVFRMVQQIRQQQSKEEREAASRPVQRLCNADEPAKMIRPAPVYTNRAHEDVIDYWMNYKI